MENKKHIRISYIGVLNTITQETAIHDGKSNEHLIFDITQLSFLKGRVLKIDVITDEQVDNIYTNDDLFTALADVKNSYLDEYHPADEEFSW